MIRPDRKMGWMPLPIRCPGCSRRIREHAILTHGGAVRCQHCDRLLYVVLAPHLALAFAAEVTLAEVTHMRASHMTPAAVIAYLGASFPSAV